MSITGQFTSKTGLIQVVIADGGASSSVEIDDIGEIKYEFDLVPDKPEVDAVQALYNKVKISIFQYSHAKEDLYDRLRRELISQDGLGVNLIVDGDTFSFFIQLNDISLSEVDRIIEMDCRVRYDPNATVLEAFDRIETENSSLLKTFLPDDDHLDETLDCTGVADWIDAAMRDIFLNEYASEVFSSDSGLEQAYNQKNYTSYSAGIPDRIGFTMVRMTSPPFSALEELEPSEQIVQANSITYIGDYTFRGFGFEDALNVNGSIELINLAGQSAGFFIVEEIVSNTEFKITTQFAPPAFGRYFYRNFAKRKNTATVTAIGALKELAAIEGAIFGSAFGKNFYINRLEEQNIVEIDWNDIVEIDTEPFYNPLGGGFVQQVARTLSSVADQEKNIGTESYGIWPVGSGNWELPVITDGRSQLEPVDGNDTEITLNLAPGYPFLSKGKGEPGNTRIVGRYNTPVIWYSDFQPTLALCRAGLRSFKKALSSDGSSDTVKFEIFQAKAIMPWQLVKFLNAPDKYSSKLFRPTTLDYDVVGDICTCEAYEIAETDKPPAILEFTGEAQDSAVRICWLVDDFVIPKEITAEGGSVASGTVSLNLKRARPVSGRSYSSGLVETLVESTPGVFNRTVNGSADASGTVVTDTITPSTITVSGSSASSGSVTTLITPPPAPSQPTICATGSALRVSWGAVAEASTYNIQRSVNGSAWTTIVSNTASTSYDDTDPFSNQSDGYQYRVNSCDAIECGSYSTPSAQTTYTTAPVC